MSDPFAAIRPFNDAEVRPGIQRLLHSPEFLTALLRLRLGNWTPSFSGLLHPLLRAYLRWQFRNVQGVEDLQLLVKQYMTQVIDDTTAGLSVSGLESLGADQAHVFISNHRDIAMDPAFTSYALHQAGHETLRIAIGDNLLTERWVADLMRLNKSFIVRRSQSRPREFFDASKLLAQYIRQSIQGDGASVWIAQREGRAKDGVDRTERAVIKMLSLSRDKSAESFGETMASLRIVPVAISYELDPCDAMKARELCARATLGRYEKAQQEDVASIGRGIAGNKGRVHVHFGEPVGAHVESPEAVVNALDKQILRGYRLHPTNLWAYRRLYGDLDTQGLTVGKGSCTELEFDARITALPEAERPFALAAYANPVKSALEAAQRS